MITYLERHHLRRIGGIAACVAMFFIVGGHWAVFQQIAWSKMLWSYSVEEGSFIAGLEKTFSGEFPCNACLQIDAEKKKEQHHSQALLTAEKKAETFLHKEHSLLKEPRCDDFLYPDAAGASYTSWAEPPPSPVPIAAC